jgi:serine/threonine-protein kinase
VRCLEDDEVVALARGGLADRTDLEDHVDSCSACRQRVATLARGDLDTQALTVDRDLTQYWAPGADAATPIVPAPGERCGRYVVEELLGRGGMGVVLAAHDPELDRRVAIKLIHPTLWQAAGSDAGAVLRGEAKAMARLVHPNVVAVFDAGDHDGQLFIAMQLVEGTTLDRWRRGRPWREVLEVCIDAGRGLAAAHRAGVVHRDVKPHNVLVGADGVARVADFGLAILGEAARGREAGLVGTPAYMSPEQFERADATAASDQFSFCVMVWEAIHGRRPFEGRTVEEIAARVAAGTIEEPRGGVADRRVQAALRRGLSVDPAARFPSMDALLAALALAPAARRPRWLVVPLAAAIAGAAVLATRGAGVATPVAMIAPDAGVVVAPAPTGTPHQQAMELLRRGEDHAALRIVDAALAATPGDPVLLVDRCWLTESSVEQTTAFRDARAVIATAPAPTRLLFEALEKAHLGDPLGASEIGQKLLAEAPSLELTYLVSDLLVAAGRVAAAEAMLDTFADDDHPLMRFMRGRLAEARSELPRMIAIHDSGIVAARARGYHVLAAHMQTRQIWAYSNLGELDRAIEVGEAAAATFAAADEPVALATALSLLSTVLYTRGDYARALLHLDRSRALRREHLSPSRVADSLQIQYLILLGRHDEARAEIATQLADPANSAVPYVRFLDGWLRFRTGDVEGARAAFAEAWRTMPPNHYALRSLALVEGELELRAGDLVRARRLLDDALVRAEATDSQPTALRARIGLAEVTLAEGRAVEAETIARQALVEVDRMGFRDSRAWGRVVLARILDARGDPAATLRAEAAALAPAVEDPVLRAQIEEALRAR